MAEDDRDPAHPPAQTGRGWRVVRERLEPA